MELAECSLVQYIYQESISLRTTSSARPANHIESTAINTTANTDFLKRNGTNHDQSNWLINICKVKRIFVTVNGKFSISALNAGFYIVSCLNIRKSFFSNRIVHHWNDLTQEIFDLSSVNSFKNRLDKHWIRNMGTWRILSFPPITLQVTSKQ